ncbi:MAG: nucleotidyltransferase family protein [Candidatus Omnitrophica bacterium]|nr:nucleotidyltransferase family protein [Candidatus Omnitrophota bacterium]
MKTVVLAAGYATRLYPLTQDKPKALLPVGKKLLLDHLLGKLGGVPEMDEVVLVTNHRFAGQFSDWAKSNPCPCPIRVLDDGTTSNDNRLGAVGDLQFAIREAGLKEDLMVLASDNLFDEGFRGFCDFALKHPRSASVGVYDIGDPSIAAGRYGVIECDSTNKIVGIEEKPDQPKSPNVSTGVYFFPQSSFQRMDEYLAGAERKDAPGHYVRWLAEREAVYAYVFGGRWFDIGSLDQLEEASKAYNA